MPVKYVRRRGVVCYELNVFHNRDRPLEELPEELFQSGLVWVWTSNGDPVDPSPMTPPLPLLRRWTTLDGETAVDQIRDIEYYVEEEYCGRAIVLVGYRPEAVLELNPSASSVATEITNYAAEMPSPIEIVVTQMGDIPWDYVFVPHSPSSAASTLLRLWGADRGHKERRYFWLAGATLAKVTRYLQANWPPAVSEDA